MKYGINTSLWAARFGPEQYDLLPRLRDRGFQGIEIPMIRPEELDTVAIRRQIEAAGLECTVYSALPAGLSAIARDKATRQKTRRHVESCIQAAAECGAKLMAGPLYAPVGTFSHERRTEQEWQAVVEFYAALGSMLERFDMDLAVEPLNRFETYFLNTASDATELAKMVGHPRVGVLFNTFHANIEEKDISLALEACGPQLKHFHASENDRGVPGTGHVTWASIFLTLVELGYQGWITIESFGFRLGELSASAPIWRDLAPTPEAIAFDGLEFLSRLPESVRARS